MAATVSVAKLIAAPPALVQAVDDDLNDFLAGLSAPDFLTVADTKALWAVEASDVGAGTSGPGDGTAWIVSAETFKRAVRGKRYT